MTKGITVTQPVAPNPLPAANPYLRFELAHDTGKTQIWRVLTRYQEPLGLIKWFGRWRQYAFEPCDNTTFNPDCLDTITANIRWLMAERRRRAALAEAPEPADDGPGFGSFVGGAT